MFRPTAILALVLAFAVTACATPGEMMDFERSGDEVTTLQVDNQAGLDMNIYVISSSGSRQRLGTAIAHQISSFTIPDRMMQGAPALRFQIDPIGGSRAPMSREIPLSRGETIILQIPAR